MSRIKAEVHTNAELDNMMRALECTDTTVARAFDVLRIALGIVPEQPQTVCMDGIAYEVGKVPNRIEANK